VPSAEHFVGDDRNIIARSCAIAHVTDHNLAAFDNHYAIDGSRIVNCPRTAPTQCFNLQNLHPIAQFDQARRARK